MNGGPQRAALAQMIRRGVEAGLLQVVAKPYADRLEALADALWDLRYRRECRTCGRSFVSTDRQVCETCRKRAYFKDRRGRTPGRPRQTPRPVPPTRDEPYRPTPGPGHPWSAGIKTPRQGG